MQLLPPMKNRFAALLQLAVLAAAFVWPVAAAVAASAQPRPNVLFVYFRRLGLARLRCLREHVGQDAQRRPGGAGGRALHECLYDRSPKLQPLPGDDSDRAQYVAARGGRLSQRNFPERNSRSIPTCSSRRATRLVSWARAGVRAISRPVAATRNPRGAPSFTTNDAAMCQLALARTIIAEEFRGDA